MSAKLALPSLLSTFFDDGCMSVVICVMNIGVGI
jgi:hypothetical protein